MSLHEGPARARGDDATPLSGEGRGNAVGGSADEGPHGLDGDVLGEPLTPLAPADVAWRVFRIWLCVRILASMVALVSLAGVPGRGFVLPDDYERPAYSHGMEAVLGVWEHGDSLWYIHLARDWYCPESEGAVFLPLYPLLIRGMHFVTGLPWLVCALLVSNLAMLGAMYLLFRLCERERGPDFARRVLWFTVLFPGNFFLLAPYTESVYLALALGAFVAARRGQWLVACTCAALMGATRNLGVLMAVPLLVELGLQWRAAARRGAPPIPWRPLLCFLIIPMGTVAVYLMWQSYVGDGLVFIRRHAFWDRQVLAPWRTVAEGVIQAVLYSRNPPGAVYILEAWAVLFTIAMGAVAFFRVRLSYALFIWMSLLPPLCNPYHGRMLISCMRYVAVAFPVFMVLADLVRSDDTERGVLAVFAGLFALSVALFVGNHYMF